MNIYIIYKFRESDAIHPLIQEYEEKNPKDKVFYFKPNTVDDSVWTVKAEEKIKLSDVVVYVRKSPQSNYSEKDFYNVNIELDLAQKHGKTILVMEKSNQDGINHQDLPAAIYEPDYLDRMCIKYKVIDSFSKKSIQSAVFDMDERLYNSKNDVDDNYYSLLLEEYKIMLDTSEKMMDRRQGTNNFYITLCSAILTASAAFLTTKTSTTIWSAVIFGASLMMIFLCDNWKKTLDAYGLSNWAKYEVLNKIENKLPASIFQSEWEYGQIIDYSSYSKREVIIPKVFCVVFTVLAVVMVIVFILAQKQVIPQDLII